MSNEAIYAVSRQGLDMERARMDAASRAIAMANTPLAPQAALDGFGKHVDATRDVHDPSNPMSGPDGMVHYPAVNMATEMTTLMSAQRGYQANIRAFNTLHGMMLKALDIGSR